MTKFWLGAASMLLTAPTMAQGFVDDAAVEITARNFYFDRDYTETSPYPAAKDWSQGVILKAQSGYTEGKVGFGLDVLATAGFKLDGSAGNAGTGNLPRDLVTNELADAYGEIGVTAKAKISQTELKLGTLQPMNPVLVASPARLLPQTYRGVSLQSKDIEGLSWDSAYINRVNHRDSTDYEKIKISGVNRRFQSKETDALYYLGGHYQFNPQWKASAFYLDVDDLYHQTMLGVTHQWDLGEKTKLTSQLRYYRSREDGLGKAGRVDNDLWNAHLELKHGNQKFIASSFQHSGETAFPYLTGGETGLTIDTWTGEFLHPKEKVYSLRYEYDFKDYVPGLRMMTRYTTGRNIHAPHLGGSKLKENELDFDVGYTIQTGFLKNLGLRARYAIYDNNMSAAANIKPAKETRINIDYTWKF